MSEEWKLPSRNGSETYIIKHENGKWSCTCPSFQYKTGLLQDKCKHIRNIENAPNNYLEYKISKPTRQMNLIAEKGSDEVDNVIGIVEDEEEPNNEDIENITNTKIENEWEKEANIDSGATIFEEELFDNKNGKSINKIQNSNKEENIQSQVNANNRIYEIYQKNIEIYKPKTEPLPFKLTKLDFEKYLVELNNGHGFNEQQKKAIFAPIQDPCYIIAGPGSGKTTVLVFRILKHIFIDEILPEEIIATTFTKKAARELKGRVIEKGYLLIEKLKNRFQSNKKWITILEKFDLNRIIIGTLDSICEEIIITEHEPLQIPYTIVDEVVTIDLFRKIANIELKGPSKNDKLEFLKQFLLNITNPYDRRISQNTIFSFLLRLNESLKQEQIKLEDYYSYLKAQFKHVADIVKILLEAYRNYLETYHILDYVGLEEKLLVILEGYFANKNKLPNQLKGIKTILIDEFQDTNYLQSQIYLYLSKLTNCSITVVGDDDQSLYRFRGAVVNIFKYFPLNIKKFLGLKKEPQPIYLNINYRSTQEIVDFYNNFIQLDASYYNGARIKGKPLVVIQDSNGETIKSPPVLFLLKNTKEELAEAISSIIRNIFDGNGCILSITRGSNASEILITRERKSTGIYCDSVLLSYSTKEQKESGKLTLMGLLREYLQQNIKVFNPRGIDLQEDNNIQILLGLMHLCLDPQETILNSLSIYSNIREKITNWGARAQKFIENFKDAKGNSDHTLKDFVTYWQVRKVRTSDGKKEEEYQEQEGIETNSRSPSLPWPDNAPLIELVYKLTCWMPIFHSDPEYILYLEAIINLINKKAEFSKWQGNFVKADEHKCLIAIYYDILVSIANGDLQINEEIIENIPDNRFNFMSIHQSKGLEFPLVFVDVCSMYEKNSAAQRIYRFPEAIRGTYGVESHLLPLMHSPPDNRTPLDHNFDDLIRLYFVAFSRPQNLLILVGIRRRTDRNGIPNYLNSFLSNIAVGFDRNNNHCWDPQQNRNPWWYITNIKQN